MTRSGRTLGSPSAATGGASSADLREAVRKAYPRLVFNGETSALTMPLSGLADAFTLTFCTQLPPIAPSDNVGLAAVSNTATIPTISSGGTNGGNALIAFLEGSTGNVVIRHYDATMDAYRDWTVAASAFAGLAGKVVRVMVATQGAAHPELYLNSETALPGTESTGGTGTAPSDWSGVVFDHLHMGQAEAGMSTLMGAVYGDVLALNVSLAADATADFLGDNYGWSRQQAMAEIAPPAQLTTSALPANGSGVDLDLSSYVAGSSGGTITNATAAAGDIALTTGQDVRIPGGATALVDRSQCGLIFAFSVSSWTSSGPSATIGYLPPPNATFSGNGFKRFVFPRSAVGNSTAARLSLGISGSGSLSYSLTGYAYAPLGCEARISPLDLTGPIWSQTIADAGGSGRTATAAKLVAA